MSLSQPVFALVDCNSFYCSCERVFNPKILKSPVVVLSNNDGCVVSRTDEAKKLGIPMGVPFFQIRELVKKNNVQVFSSNYTLYGDMSARVMNLLTEFTPDLEIYSIDEAFLFFEGFHSTNLKSYAQQIKSTIFQCTGLPICVGLGPTKVLAKMANHLAKINKQQTAGVVSLVEKKERDFFLTKVSVNDIWGIGTKSTEKLRARGIYTAQQLVDASPQLIQKLLTIQGLRIQKELQGISCIELTSIEDEQKQIMSTRSFGSAVYEINDLKEAIANHVTTACEKLRENQQTARSLSIYIRTNPFKNSSQYNTYITIPLQTGSASTSKLIKVAHQGLEKIFKENYEYKKCGVILSDLYKNEAQQLDFFKEADSEKDIKLMQVMDSINARNGKNTIKLASCGTNHFWKMLSEMKTQCFTTKWNELLVVSS